jgi:hypothetical protein
MWVGIPKRHSVTFGNRISHKMSSFKDQHVSVTLRGAHLCDGVYEICDGQFTQLYGTSSCPLMGANVLIKILRRISTASRSSWLREDPHGVAGKPLRLRGVSTSQRLFMSACHYVPTFCSCQDISVRRGPLDQSNPESEVSEPVSTGSFRGCVNHGSELLTRDRPEHNPSR